VKNWNSWHYKKLTLIFISVLFAYILSQSEPLHVFLLNLGNLGYLGAFFAGMLFVSTFTVSTGLLLLFILAEKLSPLEIGLIAGFGAVIGDFTIFRFIKDDLLEEITPLYKQFGGNHVASLFNSKYFHWTLPVLGAIIIASPFPDEIGVTLMGISKMKSYKFFILSFILNSIGIFFVVSFSKIINP